MDRRQKKTRAAIVQAFSALLETKRYGSVTVQEIIDEANVGRSTFYAHFETKDELLKTLCTDIFEHVFSSELNSEKTHDFSRQGPGLQLRLTHILHHVKDSYASIRGILSSEGGELFMQYFKAYLRQTFSDQIDESKLKAPLDFVLNHLAGSFSETVSTWVQNKMNYSPEATAAYYMEVSGLDRFIR